MFQFFHSRYKNYLSFPQKLCPRETHTDRQSDTHTHTHSHNDTLLLSLAEQAQIKSIQKPFQITGLVTSYVETAF